jgi:PST family polysaccharide transporter
MSRIRALRKLATGSLAQNTAALYGLHFTGIALSLIAIPFLARVLRPEGWGLVVFAQSFAAILTLVLEYGFYLSASRAIARTGDDTPRVAEIVAEVQAARLMLMLAITAVAVLSQEFVPLFQENPLHLFWAWVIAISQGSSAQWYYLGVERQALPAITDAISKVLATALVLVTVRDPSDGPLVLAIYGISMLIWSVAMNLMIYRSVPFLLPRYGAGLRMLRDSFDLFLFRAASGSYVTANSFLLGAMAAPPVVASFGGAERLVRGATNLIHPVTQVIYPRVSHLLVRDRRKAGEILGLSLFAVGLLGVLIACGAWVWAPQLVRLFLGEGYEAAIPIVRALAMLPPIVAVSTVLGMQWALPVGLEKPYFRLVVTGALINVVLAVVLVPRLGGIGMAGALLMAELTVFFGLLMLTRRHGEGIWSFALERLTDWVFRVRQPVVLPPEPPPP